MAPPQPSQILDAAAAPSPELAPPTLIAPTATPTPIPQTAALKLEVTSPRDNAVVNSHLITVAGLTSPDATVSVNGRLVIPDSDGRFAADLLMPLAYNPLPIEVIATSIAGEQRWVVLAVVYIP